MKWFAIVLLLCACGSAPKKIEKETVPPRKAAIAQKIVMEIHTLHFGLETPPGHPVKIEEYTIRGVNGEKKDTITRTFFYEHDRLVKQTDNEFGSLQTYLMQYDTLGRPILVGSWYKDSIQYLTNSLADVIRIHSMGDKTDDYNRYYFFGRSDSLLIESLDGPEMCYFREVKDTMLVTRAWRTLEGKIASLKLEAYDKNNRLVGITFYDNNGNEDRKILFTYDEHGNQLSRLERDRDNIIGGSSGFTAISKPADRLSVYEYDDRGNWIRCTEKTADGIYSSVTTRKITYQQ